MIQRIKPSEYLADIQTMTEGERKHYLKRVGEWLADGGKKLLQMTDRPMAQAQNIIQMSTRWTQNDCRAFREGTLLLTALMKVCDTWLPSQLYARSANRAVRHVAECFGEVSGSKSQVSGKPTLVKAPGLAITEKQKQRIVEKYTKKALEKIAAKEGADTPAAKPQGAVTAQQDLKPETWNQKPAAGVVPARPKHIDQYIHLLPSKTQELAKQYGPLKREIEAARENMRLLMNDPHSSNVDREKWAKLAARNDEKIAKINAELDREWDKVAATGRVVVDDLGMAHLLDGEPSEVSDSKEQVSSDGNEAKPEQKQETSAKRKPGRPKKQQEQDLKPELEPETKAKRLEYLKKWLRDTRTQPSDERRKQWEKNCKELISLNGEITDSIRKAGEYYGVRLDAM